MTTMSAEQMRVTKTRELEVDRPVDEVLELVRTLINFDAETAGKRKKAGCSIPLAAVLAIILFIVSGFSFGAVRMALLALAAFSVAAFVVAIVLYVRLRAQDLSDNLAVTAAPFLALLREDIAAGDPLQVKIDLRPYAIEAKKKKESAPYKAGAYYKIIDRLYVDPWFSGSAALADGTRLRWRVIDHILQKTKTKKNPRGKIKSKTKMKRKTVVVVTLAFPTKEYSVAPATDVETDAKRATMTLARKHKTAGEEAATLELLVDLIAEGYRRVKVARSA